MSRDGLPWACLFCRAILALMFLMAGFWKVFALGVTEHARRFFVEGFAESWIPFWLLWALGVAIPVVELLAGLFLLVGFRRQEALLALGAILVMVTYGHLLLEPLFSLRDHIFPRLALLVFVLAVPPERDRWSLDTWLKGRRS